MDGEGTIPQGLSSFFRLIRPDVHVQADLSNQSLGRQGGEPNHGCSRPPNVVPAEPCADVGGVPLRGGGQAGLRHARAAAPPRPRLTLTDWTLDWEGTGLLTGQLEAWS